MYVPGQRSIFAAPRPAAVHIRTNFEIKWRAEFLGGSGPRLIEQVVRFRFYFDSSVLSCMLLVAYPAMPQLVAYVHFPGEKTPFSAGLICGRVEQPQSTPAQAGLASVPAAVLWQQ